MATPRRKAPLSRTQVLAGLVERTLLPDLRERAAEPAVADSLRERWEYERAHRTTAATLDEWTTLTLTQVAVAWVLSAVFVRVLEDRGLTEHRRIAGGDATDSELLFLEMFPGLGAREYVWTAFAEVARAPVARDLLGPRGNPAWRLGPSHEAVRAMLDLFRESDADGTLRWRFDDADTRILGDLYQDLSAEVRERYALLQTPDFVERFILDRTLEPAIATFGIDAVRVIDPTCGSGHFLLGAFHRLLAHLERARPGADRRELAAEALSRVYGSDVNPYAVAIARFRLLLAFVEVCGVGALADAPALPSLASNVVVADSLLLGAKGSREMMELAWTGEDQAKWGPRAFDFADPVAVNKVFRQRFHAVVGNPPYIVCRDSALREKYREGYPDSAQRQFALAAPFTERFFKLAEDGGYVGLINANSFMKREFGKGLVEKVLPKLDLHEVIDTSGAFIPGHGTPTVILFGRHRRPEEEKVRVVMGRRGEPETPADPAKGKVWSSIAANDGNVGFENEYITVADVPRATLAKHPWSLGGGGAGPLKELIERRCEQQLANIIDEIGTGAVTREDELYLTGASAARRMGVQPSQVRILAEGEFIRDWSLADPTVAIWPYDPGSLDVVDGNHHPEVVRALWPWRRQLAQRVAFGKTQQERGLVWFEYSMFFRERLRTQFTIAYAFVATHNHFVLDRERSVFKQSAPIIKLPATASEADHHAVLAWLNSSTACFWMRNTCFTMGMNHASEANSTPFLVSHQFNTMQLERLPIKTGDEADRLAQLAAGIDATMTQRGAITFESLLPHVTSASTLDDQFRNAIRRRINLVHVACAAQEEVDWTVYSLLGLTRGLPLLRFEDIEPVVPGERPFEVHLGRTDPASVATGWFRWNETKPAKDVPARLPEHQRKVYAARVAAIEASSQLQLLESPFCKRRWAQPSGKAARELESDEKVLRDQAFAWVSDRVETIVRAESEQVIAARDVIARALHDRQFVAVAEWLAKYDGVEFDARILAVLTGESVAYLAAMRHTDEGLRKRAQWERTWDLQRDEDAGKPVGEIPVPPKYDQKDYRESRYWSLRGKLDVPRERFIAYPGAETDPRAPLFGWAGWDHLQRARALATVYNERRQTEGWDRDRLRPLLAGLMELVPWLMQWHDAPDPELDGQGQGRMWREFVEGQRHEQRWTEEELRAWRPATSAEKKAAKKAAKAKG